MGPGARRPLLDECRREHDRQAHDEQPQRQARKPVGQAEHVADGADSAEDRPRCEHIDAQHLPQAALVDLADQVTYWPSWADSVGVMSHLIARPAVWHGAVAQRFVRRRGWPYSHTR